MISRVEGELVGVSGGSIELRCGDLTFTLLVSSADSEQLAGKVGLSLKIHTLCYLESHGQGSSFVPRLVGFPTAEARAFFELLTTVKGLGTRKALRASTLPYQTIARAIADKDADLLQTLPEIGQRTAETIVAELHGKVDRFAEGPAGEADGPPGRAAIVRDALAVMTMLGEPKLDARRLLDRVIVEQPEIESADDLVAAAYRVRGVRVECGCLSRDRVRRE